MLRVMFLSILMASSVLSSLVQGASVSGELTVQVGHSGRVLCVAFSPDGEYLASGGQEGSLKVWEVDTGRIVYSKPHGGPVHSTSFSPDGKLLASASMDGKIKFWDMTTGELTREAEGTGWWDERHVGTVYFSQDWKYVAIIKFKNPAGWPVKCNTVTEIREVATWNLLYNHESRYSAQGTCVAFSPDEKSAALGFRGYENIKLVELPAGKIVQELGAGYVYFVVFSNDGRYIATSDRSGRVSWWDVETGKKVRELEEIEGYNWSNWSEFVPDDELFISGHDNTEVRFWDSKTGKRSAVLDGYKVWKDGGGICHLDVSRDGRRLATAVGKAIGIWDIESRKLIRLLCDEAGPVLSAAFSPDSRFIAFAGHSGTVTLWDTTNGNSFFAGPHEMSVNSLAFSPDGKLLAAGSDDGTTSLLKLPELKEAQSLKEDDWQILSVAFSPDGKSLAASSWNELIRIWGVADRRRKQVLETPKGLHHNFSYDITFSPDGKLIASGCKDSVLRIWDSVSGKLIRGIKVCIEEPKSTMDYDNWLFRKWIYGVSFSPDGKFVACGQWGGWREGYIKVYNTATGENVRTFTGHKVLCVGYSPDGKIIASGGNDNCIRLWDVATGKEIGILSGHEDFVVSISFSGDGKYLLSASMDGTAKVWDLKSRNIILTLFSPGEGEFAAYIPEGYYLSSKGAEKYIRFTREGKSYSLLEYESKFGWKNNPQKVKILLKEIK